MKILVTGGSGLLGSEIIRQLARRRMHYAAPTHAEMDITDQTSVFSYFENHEPDVVIHCAAYTRVDDAENDQAACFTVNATGTLHIAQACLRHRARLIYVSTDYVFGNGCTGPHPIDETPAPLNVYGLSKLQGEMAVRSLLSRYFIVRAGWIYGLDRPGFAASILRRAAQGEPLRVVNDQQGVPTLAKDLAEALIRLTISQDYGIHAAVPQGSATWYDFARALVDAKGLSVPVSPISSAEWPSPARRPANSLMIPTITLPDWRQSLQNAMRP